MKDKDRDGYIIWTALALKFSRGYLQLLYCLLQSAMGLVHLGFVTSYLSRPLVSGFTTGAAFIVFTSQVKYFFGIQPPRYVGALALPKVSPNFVICIYQLLGIVVYKI